MTHAFLKRLFPWPVMWVLLAIGTLTGCETNPYTGRSQLLIVSADQMNQMGAAQYGEVLKDPKVVVSKNPQEIEVVNRVAKWIIEAAKRSKYAEAAKAFEWEVTVIKDDHTKNAWAMPGGKIAVYTGIFPMAKDEAGLAAIMGHEVIHALAQHGGERMSHGTFAQAGLTVSNIGMAILGVDPALNQLAMAALGAGTQGLVLLPFSRKHESEADYVGVLLAADAGYDPREAIHIWERMAAASEGAPPEFMSTHPSHETRISDLKGWMPEAMAIYKGAAKADSVQLPMITPAPVSSAKPK